MPQTVAAKVGEQQGILLALQQDFIVAVTNDPAQGFVERSLMLRLTKPIDENEISIAINSGLAVDTRRKLSLLLLLECFLHKLQHWNRSDTI